MPASRTPRWIRVPLSYRHEQYFRQHRRVCAKCGKVQPQEWTYGEGGRTIVCAEPDCGQVFYEYEVPLPPAKPAPTPADVLIERKIAAAEARRDAALDTVVAAMRRVAEQRKRIARLRAALRVSAAERSARAKKGLETRKRPKRPRRGIRLPEEEHAE